MSKLKFQIVTPERVVFSQEIDSLTCPTTTGQITILPDHVPLISSLAHGELVARVGERTKHIAVSGGFVEVRPGNEVVVLADTAEHAEEIDEKRAEEAKERAMESMKNRQTYSEEEYAKIAAALQKNLTRIRVARKARRQAKLPKNTDEKI